jgi:hypothetical protein
MLLASQLSAIIHELFPAFSFELLPTLNPPNIRRVNLEPTCAFKFHIPITLNFEPLNVEPLLPVSPLHYSDCLFMPLLVLKKSSYSGRSTEGRRLLGFFLLSLQSNHLQPDYVSSHEYISFPHDTKAYSTGL